MLLKTAVVKESVDQMELVNVTLVFTWRIVQVSLRYGIFLNTMHQVIYYFHYITAMERRQCLPLGIIQS